MSTVLQEIARKNSVEIEAIEKDVALGKCKDFASYQHTCGIVRGLRIANGNLQETAQQLEENDDD